LAHIFQDFSRRFNDFQRLGRLAAFLNLGILLNHLKITFLTFKLLLLESLLFLLFLKLVSSLDLQGHFMHGDLRLTLLLGLPLAAFRHQGFMALDSQHALLALFVQANLLFGSPNQLSGQHEYVEGNVDAHPVDVEPAELVAIDRVDDEVCEAEHDD